MDVAGIPPIALDIPDFEGEAILRIFSNSTQSEIGCFSAVVTNGATFSQPAAVAPVLGAFTMVAVIASFATAIYGNNIPEMRKHYAHSLSVLVVFAVWHHIYFTGALSTNWPSVLVAFWSNYAFAGGMIYTESMQNVINNFIESNKRNTSIVGAAGTGVQTKVGGGYDISKIYNKRDIIPGPDSVTRHLERTLAKRKLAGSADGFNWYGSPVKPGLPLPGHYSGFAGSLATHKIPASNAFMTGLLWFLILVAAVAFAVIAFKFVLEGLSLIKLVRKDRLSFFRTHWLGYTALAVLRTLFIGFFMIVFLCLFQFTYLASSGPVAVASIILVIMVLGLGGLAGYACIYRIKCGHYVSEPDRLNIEKRKVLKVIPWYGVSRSSSALPTEDKAYAGSLPWWRVRPALEGEKSVHENEDYTKKFGWLSARFRRTRWWFFVVWLVYEFVRACFLAGAAGRPRTQIYGLLAVEFIAFIGLIILRPFEGQRLNLIVIYPLGFSKVATTALSAAFDPSFNIPRIPTTVIGVVIIVIQGILTIIVLIAIVVGAISTYFSLTRNRDKIRPKKWNPTREKYFKHIDSKVLDIPPPPPPVPGPPRGPYFSVNSIKRVAKIEDEDPEFMAEIAAASQPSLTSTKHPGLYRAASVRSQMSNSNLPYGARMHRASWSSRDFSEYEYCRRKGTSSTEIPDPESRPRSTGSGTIPQLDTQMISKYDGIPSPVSPVMYPPHNIPSPPPFTVPSPPPNRSRSGESLQRPKSGSGSLRSTPSSSRPLLRTVLSEDEIPTLPKVQTNK